MQIQRDDTSQRDPFFAMLTLRYKSKPNKTNSPPPLCCTYVYLSTWSQFAYSANQHPKSIVKKKKSQKPLRISWISNREFSPEMYLPCLIIIQSYYFDYRIKTVRTLAAFRTLFTWSRRTTRAKDYLSYPQINEVGKSDHVGRVIVVTMPTLTHLVGHTRANVRTCRSTAHPTVRRSTVWTRQWPHKGRGYTWSSSTLISAGNSNRSYEETLCRPNITAIRLITLGILNEYVLLP